MTEFIGLSIDNYKIIEQIGQGGMATVYRAHQESIGRDVAIKVLDKSLIEKDPSFLDRFIREVKVIASLQHPHILPIYDYGEYENHPFMVISYITGGTLTDLIEQGPMSLAEIFPIFKQITSALDFAHAQGIIHRDLKPSNILLDDAGNTYLADFGLAKVNDSDNNLTVSGGILGTPNYIAPDFSNEASITSSVDIYSLGITLYQMLTGKVPFTSTTPMGVLMAHISSPIPYILEERPNLPPRIQEVIEMVLAKNSKDRYETADQLYQALVAINGTQSQQVPSTLTPIRKGLIFTDVEGHIIYVNNDFLSMVKRPESDARILAGKLIHDVLGGEPGQIIDMIQNTIKIGSVNDRVFEIKTSNNEFISTLITSAATFDEKGKAIGVDLIIRRASTPTGDTTRIAASAQNDFSTGEKTYIQVYFTSQLDAIRILLVRLGGKKLGQTLERIINETAERNEWSVKVDESMINMDLLPEETHVYNALLVKAITYASSVIGAGVVEKQMKTVEEQMGEKALKLGKKLGLQEILSDLK